MEIKLALTGELANAVKSFGIMPVRITTAIADIASGNPAATVAAVVFSTSLLSAIFLHGSFSQILANAIFLWVFGQKVEGLLGHGRYLAFYLICGVLTGVVQILLQPTLAVPLLGANGAIASRNFKLGK
ncbi:rhomboid family intramembrane serine protease [Planktothrix sp. FACHB-1355]|uniref:Rhomboid family intramembrane serine protease n=1 Tax=Aerosakkonema funiforme FACHB-1375 TaxID=2949571 RepID=A0A926VB13_9CYAN|nr:MULTISPECIES: rhomboid family intramembrane serine protease [Oscillatoriales]MBD2180240.1 rhomboid family intramembrane serine protease [Aerosakkonema funiforme FACHB-1375]MBD3559944.1 rhomboid family intramembrane serine protease [Planktothrix sp. FACHB-1355]